ncbi:hypothetical protein JTE90_008364 [Oedothorax gibbosus]|uniref:Neuroguidin n=1 Tax=Oedothorax gibbosus TaxID=931172 RepID=A0AAV6TW67_9ARAC|nr:hypothetical protein JTE90_008364 [Oedothorax gibbosus]
MDVNPSDLNLEDVQEALKLVKEVPTLATNVSQTVQNILEKFQNNELETDKGLSFLDLKNHALLNYVMNLTYIILQKLTGKKIENCSAIDRLVQLRIVLEKMRPIDEKLKYQIDKMQSAVVNGSIDSTDPLRYKANPDSLNVEDEEETQEKKKESDIYVPPKISAAYYDEDNTLEGRKKKILERSQKRALSSSVLYELQKEYDTGPEEIRETIDPYKIKLNQEMKERERYEEEYMLRLPMTKKQKHESRQLLTVTNFDAKFDDISALEMESNDVSLKKRSSGKKSKLSKKYGKKKGKKKHH